MQASHICLRDEEKDAQGPHVTRSPFSPFPPDRVPSPPVRTREQHPRDIPLASYERFDLGNGNEPTPSAGVKRTNPGSVRPHETGPGPLPLPSRFIATVTDADGYSTTNKDDDEVPQSRTIERPIEMFSGPPNRNQDSDFHFRVAQYAPGFHHEGDAATLLYNLIFATDTSRMHRANPRPNTRTPDSEMESNAAAADGRSEDEQSFGSGYDDISSSSESHSDKEYQNDFSRRRSTRFRPPPPPGRRTARMAPQRIGAVPQPVVVVNRLLLEWTDLTESEIKQSESATVKGDDPWVGQSIQEKLADIALESNREDAYQSGFQDARRDDFRVRRLPSLVW